MTTPRLGAPELVSAQAAPESTVNELGRYLEAFSTRAVVKDRDLATPPGSPSDGDAYLVAASPTGAWSGQAGKIALRVSTAWAFITPKDGFEIEVEDEDAAYTLRGSTWAPSASGAVMTLTASEAISAGQFVHIHASSGAKVRKADATDGTKPVHAFAPAAVSSAASGTFYGPGGVIGGLSGLTPGAVYFLDTTAGALTATPPSGSGNAVHEVGVALSATTLLFNPKGVTVL